MEVDGHPFFPKAQASLIPLKFSRFFDPTFTISHLSSCPQVRLEQLSKEEQEAEAIKEEKDNIKSQVEAMENAALKKYREIEEREREEREIQEKEEERKREWEEAQHHFKTFDLNKDGKITKDELQHFSEFDLNKDNQVAEDEISVSKLRRSF